VDGSAKRHEFRIIPAACAMESLPLVAGEGLESLMPRKGVADWAITLLYDLSYFVAIATGLLSLIHGPP